MIKSKQLDPGQKFGRLTVVSFHHTQKYFYKSFGERKKDFYLCKCDCGNKTISRKDKLLNGKKKSCGCINKSKVKCTYPINKIIIKKWRDMLNRCFNSKCADYKYYGGRGITVCIEWKNDFMSFYNWAIENGYKDDLTIDRIDVNGNYEPSNCRWVTKKEQQRNKRNNRYITYSGKTLCLADWARLLKIDKNTVKYRLNKGLPLYYKKTLDRIA